MEHQKKYNTYIRVSSEGFNSKCKCLFNPIRYGGGGL